MAEWMWRDAAPNPRWDGKRYPVGGSRTCRCGRKFGTYRERLMHLQDHDSPTQARCRCGQVFADASGVKKHLRRCPAKGTVAKQLLNLDPSARPSG